jgi:hypothetical protein
MYKLIGILILLDAFSLTSAQNKRLCQNEPKASNVVKIPDNLKAVFQNSCMPCHWKGGRIESTIHVNNSK